MTAGKAGDADLDGPPPDAGTAAMSAALAGMGLRVGYAGAGWYAAEDTRTGLVRYRWQRLSELRRQLYAEHGEALAEDDEQNAQEGSGDMTQGKVGAETRSMAEPHIAQITRMETGRVVYEVNVQVGRRTRYGGRHADIEAARASRDALLAERPEGQQSRRRVRETAKPSNAVEKADGAHAEAGVLAEAAEAAAAFREGLNVNGVPVLGADFAGLMRLYALALSAERDYALARGKAEALYRAREEAWAALQAHMAADVERVAAG